jgi:hypothetical protein
MFVYAYKDMGHLVIEKVEDNFIYGFGKEFFLPRNYFYSAIFYYKGQEVTHADIRFDRDPFDPDCCLYSVLEADVAEYYRDSLPDITQQAEQLIATLGNTLREHMKMSLSNLIVEHFSDKPYLDKAMEYIEHNSHIDINMPPDLTADCDDLIVVKAAA